MREHNDINQVLRSLAQRYAQIAREVLYFEHDALNALEKDRTPPTSFRDG